MKNKSFCGRLSIFIFILLFVISLVYAGEVNREFSDSSISVGDTITVSLDVNVEGESYYAIDEVVPNGFEIVSKGGGDSSESGHIKWVEFMNAKDITYEYKIRAKDEGDYSFSGKYAFQGDRVEREIIGDKDLVVSNPADNSGSSSSSGKATYSGDASGVIQKFNSSGRDLVLERRGITEFAIVNSGSVFIFIILPLLVLFILILIFILVWVLRK